MDFQTSGPKSEANAEVTLAAIFFQVLYFIPQLIMLSTAKFHHPKII